MNPVVSQNSSQVWGGALWASLPWWCSLRLSADSPGLIKSEFIYESARSTAGFLTDWKVLARGDGEPLHTKTSHGYGTGLNIVTAMVFN